MSDDQMLLDHIADGRQVRTSIETGQQNWSVSIDFTGSKGGGGL